MDPTRADALLAATLFVGGMIELAFSDDTQKAAVVIPATVIATTLLAYRRRAPVLVVLAITVVAAVGEPLGGYLDNTVGGLGPYLFAVFTAGAAVTDVRRLVLLGVGISLILIDHGLHRAVFDSDPGTSSFIPLIAVAAPLFAGRLIGGQVRLSHELHEKNLALELEREERARAAVADERARVARELHDVVAHSVSVMVVQAGAARRVLATDPSRAATSFGAVEAVGRDALVEMRRLLGMLRPDDEPAQRAPQPGLGRLDDLVERARAAGLDVQAERVGYAAGAAAGARPRRLSRVAGGADQRAQARDRCPRDGRDRVLAVRARGDRRGRRRPGCRGAGRRRLRARHHRDARARRALRRRADRRPDRGRAASPSTCASRSSRRR